MDLVVGFKPSKLIVSMHMVVAMTMGTCQFQSVYQKGRSYPKAGDAKSIAIH